MKRWIVVGVGLFTFIKAAPPMNKAIVSAAYPLFYPTMVKESKGSFYLAFEVATGSKDYDVALYKSENEGKTWGSIWSVTDQLSNNRRPAVGVGPNDMVYFMAEGSCPIIEERDDIWWLEFSSEGLLEHIWTVNETEWYMKCSHPTITFIQQSAWLIWEDNNDSDNPDINGTSVNVAENASTDPDEMNLVRDLSKDRYPFVIPIGLSSVLVIYEHFGDDWDIHAKKVTITWQGTTYSLDVGMALSISTFPDVDECQPYAYVSGNYVYIVYNKGDDIWISYSTDNGGSFEETEVSATTRKERWPAVAADGKVVNVAYWADDGNIYERISTDNGQTFSQEFLITSQPTALDTPRLAMVMGKENPCIVWVDNRKGHPLLYFALGYKGAPGVEEGEETLAEFLKVSPSLFHSRTEIQYGIEKEGWVDIAIYDAMGRLVHFLDKGWRVPGEYRIPWDGEELPSGVYFIQLKGETTTLNKRVVVIK